MQITRTRYGERRTLLGPPSRRQVLMTMLAGLILGSGGRSALADQMAEMAREWNRETSRSVLHATLANDPARRRRIREEAHVAAGVASDAAGVAFRLMEQRDHYRALLDELEGR